jgi:hypothetical protein
VTARPIIAAALCWYDEPPWSLAACIVSLTGFADIIVSLDGPYSLFPHASPRSSDEQRHAIDVAARHAMIPHAPILPDAEPPTQAAKRTKLYRAAANRAGRNGWVFIIDADEVLSGDYRAARDELARIGDGFDCATVTSTTGGSPSLQVRLLRAMDALTCGPEYHGMLSASDPDGRRVRIRDRREILEREHPRPRRAREIDLGKLLTITNHTNDRPDDRKAAKREYVRRRTDAGIDL